MLYLISGASRSGKTIMAREILAKKNLPYVSLDWLVMGFTNGIPNYGIHDKLFPNEIAEKIWDFLNAMVESMLWSEEDCVIEGEAILPELVSELLKKHPGKIKICFVGYTDIDIDKKVKELKDFSRGKRDWLTQEPDDYIFRHINNMVVYSKRIKEDCEKFRIRYFDTSDNFMKTIDEATNYLLAE